MSAGLELVHREYDGKRLTIIEMETGAHFVAREIGKVLGYADGGGKFVDSLREWSEDLREGEHIVKLTGEPLAAVKASLPPEMGGSRAASLVLLTERGLLRALMLAGGPVAVRFRDWAEEVLLKVAKEEPPPPPPPVDAIESIARANACARLAARLSRVGDHAGSMALLRRGAAELLGRELPDPSIVDTTFDPRPNPGREQRVLAAWRADFGDQAISIDEARALPRENLPHIGPYLSALTSLELGYIFRRARQRCQATAVSVTHGAARWVVL